jgi:hypothetical protein
MPRKKVVKKEVSTLNNETKTLVLAILVILAIVLVVANFGSITGTVVKEKKPSTNVIFAKEVITPGSYIEFEITPSKYGVNKKYRICDDGDRCHIRTYMQCGSYNSREKVSERYKTWPSWEEGVYYIKLFDYEINDFTKHYFTLS